MKLPVDTKALTSIIIVLIVMVSLSSVIIVHELNNKGSTTDTSGYQMVARANSEGSGIYIKQSVLDDDSRSHDFYCTDSEGNIYLDAATNAAAWGGLIYGTPGAATIQHVQLQQVATQLGLKWTLYQEGQELSDDTMYYIGGMASAAVVTANTYVQAGSLWEPQYSMIIADDNFAGLVLTNDLFPDHTCCIVAGMKDYMSSHVDVTERFLAAYVKGMIYVQNALADKSSDEYTNLVAICVDRTGGMNEDIIKAALENITYVYADDDTGSLSELKSDVGDLYESLESAGLLKHTIADMGFNYTSQFTNAFIDDAYLTSAVERLNADDPTLETGQSASITVACIAGDIHQIAIHVAYEMGYFSDYDITVTVSAATNGPGVAVALQNGTAQFGLMGAPPATSTTVNSMLLQA